MPTVRYNVAGVTQGSANTCWLVCFRMLALFRRQVGRPLNRFAQVLLEPGYIARLEHIDRALNPDKFARIAREFWLSAVNLPGLT